MYVLVANIKADLRLSRQWTTSLSLVRGDHSKVPRRHRDGLVPEACRQRLVGEVEQHGVAAATRGDEAMRQLGQTVDAGSPGEVGEKGAGLFCRGVPAKVERAAVADSVFGEGRAAGEGAGGVAGEGPGIRDWRAGIDRPAREQAGRRPGP